jgi:hypothetical protein
VDKFCDHTFALFDHEFADHASHMCMIKDHARCMGFFDQIKKHCKGKKVIDFGAGTGILGIYAAMCGAEEVWFIENQTNLHATIDELCKLNNVENYTIHYDVNQAPTHYFDVCLSETLGDMGIERNFTRIYSDLIARNPGCVAIPDKINLYKSTLHLEEVEKEKRYIEKFPINLKHDMLYPLPGLRPTRIDDHPVDNEQEIFSLNLKDFPKEDDLRRIDKVNHPKDHNFMVFHWKAFCEDIEFVNNNPGRSSDNFNHWCQLGFHIPKDKTLGIKLDIQKGPFVLCGNPHTDFVDNPKEYDEKYYVPSPDQFVQDANQPSGMIKWTM